MKNAAKLWLLGKHRLIYTEHFWLNLWLPRRINLCLPVYRTRMNYLKILINLRIPCNPKRFNVKSSSE